MDTQIQNPQITEKKSLKFVHVSIIVAIVIVINLLSNYAVSLVYNEPSYDTFIKPTQIVEDIKIKDKCIAVGGQWSENAYPTEKGQPKVEGYCNVNYTNQLNYDKARASYEKKVFITLTILGVLLIALAGFLSIEILSVSFAWAGVLSLLIASMRYWSLADGIAKVVILTLALAMLIWIAVKKFNK
ncbi:MAG: hypothetical protein NTU81_02785 [Candidatus Nomurabacteria bacterium]|nr:hypothetical protein [Candidatus Nomurabacteria bacterium]